jgi:Endonuclease-reverse transcriptase
MPEEPAILCGDFNIHAPDWDSTVLAADARTNEFQDWLMANKLAVLSNPAAPTFHRHHFQHAKADDLVIANVDALGNYDIGPVRVHTDAYFASQSQSTSSCAQNPYNTHAKFIFSAENREK